jgi:hypothetical protein
MMAARPAGVIAAAIAFLAAGAYLLVAGLTMIARPGLVSMAAGAELMGGLELAGPYMFLLVGSVGEAVGLGLLRLHKWARWTAILAAIAGVVFLLPSVSSAVFDFHIGRLAWAGLGTIIRVMIVWYLFQPHISEAFERA